MLIWRYNQQSPNGKTSVCKNVFNIVLKIENITLHLLKTTLLISFYFQSVFIILLFGVFFSQEVWAVGQFFNPWEH